MKIKNNTHLEMTHIDLNTIGEKAKVRRKRRNAVLNTLRT